MSGRILVIDPNAERRRELGRILTTAYFHVIEARSLDDVSSPFDMILCAEPETLGALRGPLAPESKPILALTGDGGPRIADVLAAGADDCLLWPSDPAILLARARNLLRNQIMSDELALRQATARDLGLEPEEPGEASGPARVLVIAPGGDRSALAPLLAKLPDVEISFADTGFAALRAAEREAPDLVIVAESSRPAGACGFAESEDALGIISALRARPAARSAAIIHLGRAGGRGAAAVRRVVSAFEAGASDSAPLNARPEDLAARLLTRLNAKRRNDAMRAWLDGGLRLAAIDALTGLHNRRYFDQHLTRLFEQSRASGAALSALLFDIDRFKSINDDHGHGAGDAALRAFAERLREGVRGADLVARVGGEEFAVILKNASAAAAAAAAERVRAATSGAPVTLANGEQVRITVSAGVATLQAGDQSPIEILDRADAALNAAKRSGRNRVQVTSA